MENAGIPFPNSGEQNSGLTPIFEKQVWGLNIEKYPRSEASARVFFLPPFEGDKRCKDVPLARWLQNVTFKSFFYYLFYFILRAK